MQHNRYTFSMPEMTTIKVPTATRDRVRRSADAHGVTQAALIDLAVEELEAREWLAQVAAFEPDEGYLRELREWDQADIAPGSAL